MRQRIPEMAEGFDDLPNIIIGGWANKSLGHLNLGLEWCAFYVVGSGIPEMEIDEVRDRGFNVGLVIDNRALKRIVH